VLNLVDMGDDGTPEGYSLAMAGENGPAQTWSRLLSDAGTPVLGGQGTVDPYADHFPLLLYDKAAPTDVSMAVRFRITHDGVGHTAGLVVRYQEGDRYYVARADADARKVSLARMDGGNEVGVAETVGIPVDINRWHTLKLDTRGHQFKIWLDDALVLNAEDFDNDGRIDRPGKVGLFTVGNSLTLFDDLRLTEYVD
jgi:hypothetical protein